jgi:hypothetical protein
MKVIKKDEIKFEIIAFKEVNFELKSFVYFEDKKFSEKKLFIDYNFHLEDILVKEKEVVIFQHIRLLYELNKKKEEYFQFYHADYISAFEIYNFEQQSKLLKKNAGISVSLMKSLLEISSSTLRGYLLARHQGTIIHDYPLPVLNFTELLQSKSDFIKNDFFFVDKV